jgi:hypothetical protein
MWTVHCDEPGCDEDLLTMTGDCLACLDYTSARDRWTDPDYGGDGVILPNFTAYCAAHRPVGLCPATGRPHEFKAADSYNCRECEDCAANTVDDPDEFEAAEKLKAEAS